MLPQNLTNTLSLHASSSLGDSNYINHTLGAQETILGWPPGESSQAHRAEASKDAGLPKAALESAKHPGSSSSHPAVPVPSPSQPSPEEAWP